MMGPLLYRTSLKVASLIFTLGCAAAGHKGAFDWSNWYWLLMFANYYFERFRSVI